LILKRELPERISHFHDITLTGLRGEIALVNEIDGDKARFLGDETD
jgi:hypothetical protein